MKILSGSILTGLSLLAQVLNEWFSHFFYAVFQIAKGAMLQGGGGFTTPPMYTNPGMTGVDGFGVDIFLLTRVLIWVFIAAGIGLMAWGLREQRAEKS